MRISLKLAYKNLIRAGLKTWLNSLALSFAFVLIIFYNGMIDGWNNEARQDAIDWAYGNGHLRYATYDPVDPFSIQDGHGIIPEDIAAPMTPVLVWQGSIYPQGRMMSVLLKGLDVNQQTIKIPIGVLKSSDAEYPVLLGKKMAESAGLATGDKVLLRWRDKHGTFDAVEITVAGIFNTNVPFVDGGQVWMPLDKLQQMTGLEDEATYLIAGDHFTPQHTTGWNFVSQQTLLQPVTDLINAKRYGAAVMYLLLLAIGLLVIFDTQALSIFRRQKEIGTHIAMGMTKGEVIRMFTVEGAMYSIFATILGGIYGTPLFIFLAKHGISFPVSGDTMGIIIAPTIYSHYGIDLILKTLLLLVISATLVSLLATRKIAKMNPVEALKGKAL